MTEYLLVGTRQPIVRELSPAGVAREMAAATSWHQCLRRWGLLRYVGLPQEPDADVRACLVIQASGQDAATRLASGWGRVSGYRVSVTRLRAAATAAGGAR
jgi:hypothetical protein